MITDEYLQRVRQLPKRVSNPQARWTHRQRNFQATASDSDETFQIFQRLNFIAANRKPESEAQETGRYHSIEGALACLVADYNVSGIEASQDQPRLF